MKIELGKKVYCTDKEVGSVSRIVLDSEAFDVSQLVVITGPAGAERLVPITDVEAATDEGVRLAIDSARFGRLADFIQKEYQSLDRLDEAARARATGRIGGTYPALAENYLIPYTPILPVSGAAPPGVIIEHERLAPGECVVAEGMDVYSSDQEKLGSVREVSYDPSDKRLQSFEIEKGLIFTDHTTIPADWIGAVEPEKIKLNRTKDQVKDLQEAQGR